MLRKESYSETYRLYESLWSLLPSRGNRKRASGEHKRFIRGGASCAALSSCALTTSTEFLLYSDFSGLFFFFLCVFTSYMLEMMYLDTGRPTRWRFIAALRPASLRRPRSLAEISFDHAPKESSFIGVPTREERRQEKLRLTPITREQTVSPRCKASVGARNHPAPMPLIHPIHASMQS